MSWWSNLFGGKKQAEEPKPEKLRPPTYQELVAKIDELRDTIAQVKKDAAEVRRRISNRARDDQALLARYREALEFYAKEESWRAQGLSAVTPTTSDRGHRARKALGRI